MEYGLRWTIPFKSLNGTDCLIEIYDKNYAGTSSEISKNNPNTIGWAAEDPFYYEENDSDNLLDVVRARSGYIKLNENNYGDLNVLFPQTNTDRYVKVYYGTTLSFTGYIKAESFGLNWGDYHREINLPVISPLYLADGMWFTPPNTPEFKTIGRYLYDVIKSLDENIMYVVFPDPDFSEPLCILSTCLCSLAICPQDVNWKGQTAAVDFYSGKSFKYFIEGICNAFGLIVHDEPGMLVFSRFDYDGYYSSLHRTSLLQEDARHRYRIQDSNATEALKVNISNSNNEEYAVLPLSKITVDGDGEYFSNSGLPTDVCMRSTNGGEYNNKDYGYYGPLNNILSCDNRLNGYIKTSTGRLNSAGTMIAYDGSDKIFSQKSAGQTGTPILVYFRLYNYPKQGEFTFSFDGKYGPNVEDLSSPGSHPTINVSIKNGSKYFTTSGWSDSNLDSPNLSFSEKQSVLITTEPPFLNQPIEICMTSDVRYWDEDYIYVIENIKVDKGSSSFDLWYLGNQDSNKIINGSPSESEGSVSRAFSRQWRNSNYLSTGTVYEADAISEPSEPLYPYLKTSQMRLQVYAKGILPDYHYVKKITFSGNTWRIIAKAFHPWNDEYMLTLHSSSILT